eukprot:TRINITY_DN7252_c0_g1_i2.p1 TRINITY_DN7252_c0_g1~~TRINITY_DN7252_c0_g1_i2.p1  ORF type:complete len:362 (-),score=101.94 TRINITY_DN7252_c0_g1_i2:91-1176(-)
MSFQSDRYDGASSSTDDETGRLLSTVTATFMYIPTLWAVAFEILVLIVFEVFLFYFFTTEDDDERYSIRSSAHVGIFVLAALFYFFMNYYSRRALTHGYINLYRSSKFVISLPVFTFAVGNALIILWHNWGDQGNNTDPDTPQIIGLQVIFSAELLVALPALLYYGRLIWKHNAAKAPPDNTKELASGLRMSLFAKTDPEMNSESYLKELSDRQTEMVRHLQHQKENLSRQVVALNERLQYYEKTSYANSSEDVKLLIESKEQELRATKGFVLELEAALEKANQIQRKEEAVVLDKKQHELEKQQLEAEIKRKNEETNKLRLMYEVSKDANAENELTINQLNAEIALLKQQLNSIYGAART